MFTSGTAPPQRREAVVCGVHRPGRRARRRSREEGGCGRAEANLLALHVRGGGVDARVPVDLEVGGDADRAEQQREHRGEERPALPLAAGQPPERVGERKGDQQEREHLDEVREAGRVLERVRRVRVHDPAAVRPQLLDRLLARDRAAVDLLRRAFHGLHRRRPAQRLDCPLAREQQRDHEREWQQDAGRRPDEIDPEVADRLSVPAGETADQRDRDRGADGRGGEVLHRQPGHLGEVAHRRLAAVVLPVRVRDEADRRVERERRRHTVDSGRVEGEQPLEALERVQAEHGDDAEREQRPRVHRPRLLALRVDPRCAIQDALDRCEDAIAGSRAAPVDACQVGAEHPRAGEHERDERGDLEPGGAAHA